MACTSFHLTYSVPAHLSKWLNSWSSALNFGMSKNRQTEGWAMQTNAKGAQKKKKLGTACSSEPPAGHTSSWHQASRKTILTASLKRISNCLKVTSRSYLRDPPCTKVLKSEKPIVSKQDRNGSNMALNRAVNQMLVQTQLQEGD